MPSSDPIRDASNPPPRPRRRRTRLYALLSLLIFMVIGMRFMGCAESRAFYFPMREEFATPAGFEDVTFTTSDGLILHGWFMPARGERDAGSPAPAVLHCHGNAGNVAMHEAFSSFLPYAGVSVFIFDYRSYGRSQKRGRLSREACMTDTRAAYDFLRTRPDVDPKRIGVYGVSLGGAFALQLAADHPEIASVCTVSAFTAFPDIANDHIPLLGRLIIPRGMDGVVNATKLGTRPYLIVHGMRDDIIPPAHGERLAAAARAAGTPVETHWIAEAGHNDVLFTSDEAKQVIAGFFRRTLAAR